MTIGAFNYGQEKVHELLSESERKGEKERAEDRVSTDEALAETNDRLNSLIVVVERYFSNGRRDS